MHAVLARDLRHRLVPSQHRQHYLQFCFLAVLLSYSSHVRSLLVLVWGPYITGLNFGGQLRKYSILRIDKDPTHCQVVHTSHRVRLNGLGY